MWTVDREFEQRIRHKNQLASGGSFVANLTLRLKPDLGVPGVIFASEATNPDVSHYLSYVERGVEEFVQNQANVGREIAGLRVTLIDMPIHPVDAKGYRFSQAAMMALEKAFEDHGIEL